MIGLIREMGCFYRRFSIMNESTKEVDGDKITLSVRKCTKYVYADSRTGVAIGDEVYE